MRTGEKSYSSIIYLIGSILYVLRYAASAGQTLSSECKE